MSKNYMPEVAEMLGVEIGEEFDILYKDGTATELGPFKFTNETILDCDGDELQCWRLCCLLNGIGTIQKSPWRPKEGDTFFYVLTNGEIQKYVFEIDNIHTLMLFSFGNCFPTKAAAEAAASEMMAKFEEIKKGVQE